MFIERFLFKTDLYFSNSGTTYWISDEYKECCPSEKLLGGCCSRTEPIHELTLCKRAPAEFSFYPPIPFPRKSQISLQLQQSAGLDWTTQRWPVLEISRLPRLREINNTISPLFSIAREASYCLEYGGKGNTIFPPPKNLSKTSTKCLSTSLFYLLGICFYFILDNSTF